MDKNKNYFNYLVKQGIIRVKSKCERCSSGTICLTMSMFNTEMICLTCQKTEKEHSDYDKAVKAENEAINRGDFNFIGIGKPEDL